jgi:hypothetical protein
VSLAARLGKPPVQPSKQFCEVGKILDRLRTVAPTDDPTSEYTALVTALATPAWEAPAISMALVDEGYGSVNVRHVRQHRRGEHTETQCAAHDVGVLP